MRPNANKTAIRAYALHENARKKLVCEGEEPSQSIFFSILLVQMPQLIWVAHHIDRCDFFVLDFERGRLEFPIGFQCDEPR